jgi:hypothetical protein
MRPRRLPSGAPSQPDNRGGLVARLSGTGRLADDLYLLAHHEVTGQPHCSRAIGLGLAGALLAELVLSGTICVQPDAIMFPRTCVR